MDREVGGGIGMGNTCKPMAVSFQCMTKFTTKKKKKKKKRGKLDLIKIENFALQAVKRNEQANYWEKILHTHI